MSINSDSTDLITKDTLIEKYLNSISSEYTKLKYLSLRFQSSLLYFEKECPMKHSNSSFRDIFDKDFPDLYYKRCIYP